MSEYDAIAPFYDLVHGDRRKTIRYVQSLIRNYHAKAKTLLSVGCGTGEVCKVLAKRYTVTGTDISKAMLIEAQKKLPKSIFYVQDMRDLSLEENFDVILCSFGPLNHLLDFSEWEAFFQKAKDHLNPGGIFIFDILTELGLYNTVLNSPLIFRDGNFISLADITNDDEEGTLWQVRGFYADKRRQQQLFSVNVRQTSFDVSRIKNALGALFSSVMTLDPEENETTENSELLYFVASV